MRLPVLRTDNQVTLLFGSNGLVESMLLGPLGPQSVNTMTLFGNYLFEKVGLLSIAGLEEHDARIATYLALALECDIPILEAMYWNGPERRAFTREAIEPVRAWLECPSTTPAPCSRCSSADAKRLSRAWMVFHCKPRNVPVRTYRVVLK